MGNNRVEETEATLETPDQVAGDSVVIERVILEEPGFIVVYNQNGEVAGTSDYREAGEYENVTVALSGPSEVGDTFDVGLVTDDGDQTFNSNTDSRVSYRGRVLAGKITIVSQAVAGEDGIVGTDDDPESMEEGDAMEEESSETEETTDEESSTEAEAVVVTYTDAGFEPQEIVVSVGESITWENQSSGDMWVASALHPTHELYNGTSLSEHCPDLENNDFDQCEGGDEYTFTFDEAGEWAYHNHLNANHFGRVIVQ